MIPTSIPPDNEPMDEHLTMWLVETNPNPPPAPPYVFVVWDWPLAPEASWNRQ